MVHPSYTSRNGHEKLEVKRTELEIAGENQIKENVQVLT